MFERFTKRARQVLVLGMDEARTSGHPLIGTEHLLLGMLREGEGVAARVLAREGVTLERAREAMLRELGCGPAETGGVSDADALASIGIDLEDVRSAVEESFGPGAFDNEILHHARGLRVTSAPPFSPRAKKSLEQSLRQALSLGHNYIGTEHLLLGLLRTDGLARKVLEELVDDVGDLRNKIIGEVSQVPPSTRRLRFRRFRRQTQRST